MMEQQAQGFQKSKRKLNGIQKAQSVPASAADTQKSLKKTKKKDSKLKASKSLPPGKISSGGFFEGVHAFFITPGVSSKRLQVWRTKFAELGGTILDSATAGRNKLDLVHLLAADVAALSKEVDIAKLRGHEKLRFVQYKWIEECLADGKLLASEPFNLLEDNGEKSLAEDKTARASPPKQSQAYITAEEPATTFVSIQAAPLGSEKVPPSDGVSGTQLNLESVPNTAADLGRPLEDEEEAAEGPLEDEAPDFNKHVAEPLREMAGIYTDVLGDEWRALSYRKAANRLDKLPYRISSSEDVSNIQGMGKSMLEKISEILHSGKLQKLESLKANPQVQTIQQFAAVWGIGPKHARRLYQAGYESVENIGKDQSLSSMARIGLKYHQDIIMRIPRAEVGEAGSFVKKVLEDLCPGAWLTVGGSYRRGQSTCGDIDLLVTHPDGQSHEGLMRALLRRLEDMQFLCDGVMPRDRNDSHGADTYMGICRLQDHRYHRRIDIKVYPHDVYAFALVYFTGNDVLNRRIRYFARTKGYKLSDQGLFLRGGSGENEITSEVSIPCHTEQEIFEKLGLPYPEPHDRNW